MNTAAFMASSLSLSITVTLLHLLWLGVLIGTIDAVLNRFVRHRSARLCYGLHLFSMVLLLLCVPGTLGLVATGLSRSDSSRASNQVQRTGRPLRIDRNLDPSFVRPAQESETEARNSLADADRVARVGGGPSASDRLALRVPADWIAGSYLVGVSLMLLRVVFSVTSGHAVSRHAKEIENSKIRQLVELQAKALGLRIAPAVAYCQRVAVPAVVGVVRPMILLPVSLTGMTREELVNVLTHELAHIRRYDHLVVLLQRSFEALLFFHPATWYISRRLSHERENCCDDLVIKTGVARVSYANSLCRVAELTISNSDYSGLRPMMVAVDVRRPSHLRRRVVRLFEACHDSSVPPSRSGIVVIATALTLLSAAAGILPAVSTRAQDTATKRNRTEASHESPPAREDKSVVAGGQTPLWLRELISEVEDNEHLYKTLQLDLTHKYQKGITEILSRLTMVREAARFRTSQVTSSHDVPTETQSGGEELPRTSSEVEVTTVFDGATRRTFGRHSTTESTTGRTVQSSSNGQISDEPPALTNLARPHMFLLESGCPQVPLSVYMKGLEAVLEHPNNRNNGPIIVEDLGEDDFRGLQCRKIRIEQVHAGQPHNSWELWLAKERNFIPVRNLGYTYRWSKEIPVFESAVDEWKELRPGVWFPMKARTDRYDSRTVRDQKKKMLSWRKLYLVLRASLSPELGANTFTELEFPPGTEVRVTRNGVTTSRVQQ